MKFSWKLILGFGVVAVLVVGGLTLLKNTGGKKTANLPGNVEIAQAEPKVENEEVHAANGKNILSVQKQIHSTGNTIYSFYTSDNPATEQKLIYQTALPAGTSMSIPLNSWSPNYNRYVFLKQTSSSGSAFLVFNSNGENFASGDKFIDVSKGFADKNNGFTLNEVTGWDSETLLHIKASNGEGSANFWFEIPSGAVIRLAR